MPLLILAYLGFVSVGFPDGMLGVAWPHMRLDFGQPVGAVGFVLFSFTAGYLSSGVGAGFAIGRLGVGRLLAASTALAAAALAGFAVSPALAVVVAVAGLLGVSSGAIDAGLNAYAARHFGPRHMNWMHASYGFGATLGPLVVTAALALGLTWRGGYAAVAAGQLLLATAFVLTVRAWRNGATTREAGTAPAVPPVTRTLALPGTWLGAGAFAVYVALEVGAGLWAYLLLTEGRGLSAQLAGVAVSAYWGSLFVGRLLVGAVAERMGVHRMLASGAAGVIAGAALISLPAPGAVAVVGLMLLGLACAPVFPMLMLTTAERVGDGHADRVIGLQVGASAVGGTALPAGIGVLIGRLGPEVLGPALLTLAAGLAALYLVIRYLFRRRGATAPSAGKQAVGVPDRTPPPSPDRQ